MVSQQSEQKWFTAKRIDIFYIQKISDGFTTRIIDKLLQLRAI